MKNLILCFLVVGICLPTFAMADDHTPTWGLGWANGSILRHRIQPGWELELSGGPNDYLINETKRDWDDNDPPSEQGIEQIPQDEKREQGWVLLGVGRTVAQEGQISLTATASLRYTWSHEQRRSHSVYSVGENEQWRDVLTDWSQWDTALGLRISAAVMDQFWLEAGFGVVYKDNHRVTNSTNMRLLNGDLNEDISSSMSDSSEFQSYGWSGLSSLGVMVWF